ncbi:N-formylglutamate deformylase [Caulobacter sp. 17J80-11]|uniref:N-formylglutamate deformylase n=1 Tax=Caulobacter sp. 17J80-11 TaxID=2763502 RepID=UPI00165385FD|nr:N-formylglutamate deformylase [Caulobacter sp. 17J80-11]MBC6983451.1 N-formylglutamate deformylase [Caulobacter sp. 17J80-11]
MSVPPFRFREGSGPLVVAMPHVGTHVPPDIAEGLTDLGRRVLDTDWHIDKLYGFLDEADVTTVIATHSRTVVDLNRAPENTPLYPGRFETGLLPMTTFDGEPLYQADREPDQAETARRLETYWRPYHAQLSAALEATKAKHGYALLLDAHSIRAEIPMLFEGRLPDVNVGTADGASASPALTERLAGVLGAQDAFTWVVNGRFKGGWTTRNYGKPAEGVHAVQFELVQAAYMHEATPETFDPAKAEAMQGLLKTLVAEIAAFRP